MMARDIIMIIVPTNLLIIKMSSTYLNGIARRPPVSVLDILPNPSSFGI